MLERRKIASSAAVIWYTVLFRQNRTDRPYATRGPAFPRYPSGVIRSLDTHVTSVAQHPVKHLPLKRLLWASRLRFSASTRWPTGGPSPLLTYPPARF